MHPFIAIDIGFGLAGKDDAVLIYPFRAERLPKTVSMTSSSNTKYIIGAIAVASLVGYGVYFDHQRRNNPAFRKKLGN